ncbi:MAG: metallophosphoesterase family protein [Chloroflexi bacterium]|nr:metallophosphoesterase family protein [Chloroflexota bacterium]
MRYAIIADIHANLDAFTAVLEDIRRRGGADEFWCLGDTVGYGPEPHQCVELLRQQKHICIVGNHDLAAIGKLDISDFKPYAAAAVRWTTDRLKPDDVEYPSRLPLTIVRENFTLAHGSPRYPIWEYLLSTIVAKENFAYFQTRSCLVGHSHVPLIYELVGDDCILHEFPADTTVKLSTNRLIINPGSIGQPRDGDPRASYCIYDSESHTVSHYRVEYDIEATQSKMRAFNLPEMLIRRLEWGH